MRSFTDSKGRVWELSITVGTVRQVKAATDILITELFDDECALLVRLSKDVLRLVDVVWELCREQASSAGVDEAEFMAGLGGDAVNDAGEALARAAADFFSNREQLHVMLDKIKEVSEGMLAKMTERIKNVPIDQLVETYFASATNSPES